MDKVLQAYLAVIPYVTKDGSEIRELMHPSVHGNVRQSLAEARVPSGARTLLHKHLVSEEIYHVTAGSGRVLLGDEWLDIKTGDSVFIAPDMPHALEAGYGVELVVLCCCAPAYRHEDTVLL